MSSPQSSMRIEKCEEKGVTHTSAVEVGLWRGVCGAKVAMSDVVGVSHTSRGQIGNHRCGEWRTWTKQQWTHYLTEFHVDMVFDDRSKYDCHRCVIKDILYGYMLDTRDFGARKN
jgi:hypothetical protein